MKKAASCTLVEIQTQNTNPTDDWRLCNMPSTSRTCSIAKNVKSFWFNSKRPKAHAEPPISRASHTRGGSSFLLQVRQTTSGPGTLLALNDVWICTAMNHCFLSDVPSLAARCNKSGVYCEASAMSCNVYSCCKTCGTNCERENC